MKRALIIGFCDNDYHTRFIRLLIFLKFSYIGADLLVNSPITLPLIGIIEAGFSYPPSALPKKGKKQHKRMTKIISFVKFKTVS